MATYRYTAQSDQGEEIAGVVEASDLNAALELLIERDLRDIQVKELIRESVRAEAPPVALRADEASELTEQLSQIGTASVPMASGLRAAADETASPRMARALHWIANQIEQGRTLDDAIADSGKLLPPHVSGLILAASRTGTLGEALLELAEQQQRSRSLRYSIRSSLSYPMVVIAMAAAVLFFVGYFVLGMIKHMFDDFGLSLPMMSRLALWWRDTGMWIVLAFALIALVLAFAVRVIGGAARWRRLLSTIPLFGPLLHWAGVSEWAGLMSVMLNHQISLPEALRLAGRGTRDANVNRLSQRLADGVARGRSLSQLMFASPELPSSLIPLIEWGERSNLLADSFHVGQTMLEKRARTRSQLLQAVVPPILFIGIGSFVVFFVVASFLPMVNLISALS